MKIKSGYTNKDWWDSTAAAPPGADADRIKGEIPRALSEVIRCTNLIILTGLGTSMCVLTAGRPKAPTMGDLWTRVKNSYTASGSGNRWDELLRITRFPSANTNLEELLSQCKLAESFVGGADLTTLRDFIQQAEREIQQAVDFLDEGEELPLHVHFLQRIARRGNRKSRVKLFSTNYDLCHEQAAKAGRFAVIDGFSTTLPPTFDPVYFGYDYVRRDTGSEQLDLVPNVFHLYKLHGSIDWEHQPKTGEIVKKSKPDRPLLIYPRSNKYELAFAQPYLEMMSAFQGALREPNTGLLVIGFGFNDNHLAEPILAAIRSNLALKVAIVTRSLAPTVGGAAATPGPADTNPHLKKIQGYIDHGDARLALIEATFEEMIAHLPDLTSETELEKHMERVRKVMGPGT